MNDEAVLLSSLWLGQDMQMREINLVSDNSSDKHRRNAGSCRLSGSS